MATTASNSVSTRRFITYMALAGLTVTDATMVRGQIPVTSSGQPYPYKPIRFLVPFPAGGATDIIARIVGQKLTDATGQQVILDNRGGGSSIVGTELAARAAPDGYTMLLGSFAFAITPALHERLPYDTLRDFAGVSMIGNGQAALVVHPAVPAQTVKELIALARAKPGGLSYSSTGGGSASNLGALLFQHMAGVIITRLNNEVVRAVRNAAVQENLNAQGVDPVSSSPAELSKYIAAEVAKWSRVIKETGARHE